MQDYVDPNENNYKITSSPSMYVRIKSWLLNGSDNVSPEEIRGDLVNQKVFITCLQPVKVIIRPSNVKLRPLMHVFLSATLKNGIGIDSS